MKKTKVVVLAGGWSEERDVSLESGKAVCDALDKNRYDVVMIDPSKDICRLVTDRENVDIVFSLLHGKYGEDGSMQGMLQILGVPFVGSGVLASALSFNKRLSKEVFRLRAFKVPNDIVLRREDVFYPDAITAYLGDTTIVKPVSEGSSIGVSLCRTEKELRDGIEKAFGFGDEVLVEEYIKGREISVCVIGNRNPEVFPVVEIVPDKKFPFFDYRAKYTKGETEDICPADIPEHIATKASNMAKDAHKALMCSVWSRTDIIVRDDDLYLLETNTIPGMTKTSLFPLAAQAYGLSFSELVDRLIKLSFEKDKE